MSVHLSAVDVFTYTETTDNQSPLHPGGYMLLDRLIIFNGKLFAIKAERAQLQLDITSILARQTPVRQEMNHLHEKIKIGKRNLLDNGFISAHAASLLQGSNPSPEDVDYAKSFIAKRIDSEILSLRYRWNSLDDELLRLTIELRTKQDEDRSLQVREMKLIRQRAPVLSEVESERRKLEERLNAVNSTTTTS